MNAQDMLRAAIAEEERRLQEGIPPDRQEALLALLRAQNDRFDTPHRDREPDPITGSSRRDRGETLALALCLQSPDAGASPEVTPPTTTAWAEWATRHLRACDRLAVAQAALSYVAEGSMRLVAGDFGSIHAWFASKLRPPEWRERQDIDWWAASLATRYEPELHRLLDPRFAPEAREANDRRRAELHVAMMADQLTYPLEAIICGVSMHDYLDVLRYLIQRASAARESGETPLVVSSRSLIEQIATSLSIDPAVARQAVAGLTLDAGNAAYHAGLSGGTAPIVGPAADRLALSFRGLVTEPLFFLSRELRRLDATAYHNIAYLREERFRRDLYALYTDKRFVTSAGRVQVRRDQGNLRTDIDAAIFDRKSGALAIFELKSHDPFARPGAELARQRDNVLYANRQIAGVLDWLKRHGADDLLSRIDQPTAKRYRVRKVFPFVLARYLVRFNDGPAPDRRAVWGTWPQLLRTMQVSPPLDSTTSPLSTLFSRLSKDDASIATPVATAPVDIALGSLRLMIHPSYAAFKATLA